jgi:integrase/recombinase XerD
MESILIKKFLNFLDMNGSSKNTIDSYKKDLDQFILFILDDSKSFENEKLFFQNISQEEINAYIEKLYQNQIQNNSLARKISCIRSFFKFIFYEMRLIDVMPNINLELPKIQRKIPLVLSKNEINSLINLSLEKSRDDEDKMNLTWLLMNSMLEFLYSSGCRISEALSIKIGSIINQMSEISNEIFITGKGSKERIVFINNIASISIKNFLLRRFCMSDLKSLKNSNDFLFSTKINSKNSITRQRIFQLLQELGLQLLIDKEKLSPHKIRHSIAIHMLNYSNDKNIDEYKKSKHDELVADIRLIQEFLGHKTINTTQIYLEHQNYKNLKNTVEKRHPLSIINNIIEDNK